ncbi:hypothetical protein MKW92_020673 [Papaver armeniacum]|nr:hypothetical protein MKW92_020673 [Papaver armeniacum]
MSGEVSECSAAMDGFTMLSTVLSPILCSLGGISTFSKRNNNNNSKRRTMSERLCMFLSFIKTFYTLSVSLNLRNGYVRIMLLPSAY